MVAVDEMMVAFKRRHKLKCYIPQKPTKWGYKLWTMAGVSGYVCNFEIVVENDAESPPTRESVISSGVGESGYVVLKLADNLAEEKHKKFFDNYFASPELHVRLKEKKYIIFTLRVIRSRHCPFSSENNLKKKCRGAIEEVIGLNDGIVVCVWYDNKRLVTMSNYLGKNPVSECSRYDRSRKIKIKLPRPAVVQVYYKFMGGVDKTDMLISLYKTKCKTKKWYH